MASRMDWIMSFIRCATLIAPSTLKAVEASCAAASRAGPGAATGRLGGDGGILGSVHVWAVGSLKRRV